MTDRQKYIRRIQKLKALAKGEAESGNEKAAESAARIIAKMMLEHAIADAEIEAEIDDEPLIVHHSNTGQQKVWLRSLYYAVARANNCTGSYVRSSDIFYFYGTESDCEIAEYLSVYLAREVRRAADRHIRQCRRAYGYVPKGERNGFCRTATNALHQRLQAMRREAAEEARQAHGEAVVSTALVLLSNKLAKADAFAASFGLGAGRSSNYRYNAAGHAAGKNININKGLGGQTAKAVTG